MASSCNLSLLVVVATVMASCCGSRVRAEADASAKRLPSPRSDVVVEGVVYCKSCAYKDVDTLVGATPLPGATVKLVCNNTRVPTVVQGTADKNGYFYIESFKQKVTTYGVHKCSAYLGSSSNSSCNIPTNLNGGVRGGPLRFERILTGHSLTALFAAGPFAFAPTTCGRAPPPSASISPPPPPHH